MRGLGSRPGPTAFPELSAHPDGADLLGRWEALLGKAPRLRPWLEQTLDRHRLLLLERAGRGSAVEIEQSLRDQLARWLGEFEALPQFAVSAIATTLEERERPARERGSRNGARGPEREAELPDSAVHSPECAVVDAEMLLSDPAFALAFHCVEVRVRPQLAAALEDAPSLSRVPETAWFGLLHASAKVQPLLTPDVAVALVLRVLSAEWTRLPGACRKAALRLFLANPTDLRGGRADEGLRRLCDSLPAAWGLEPGSLSDFVAAAGRARVALENASQLCTRIGASIARVARGTRRGGFALLQQGSAVPASAAELVELAETARKHAGMKGFRRLAALL